ncbi:hypothetical protein [Actinomadura sp. 9N407]|uniref:hypothetical protein n=1 Tax=Actinomadura sp. 9N407 TaxID=3375154 RepID=UPI0037A481B5
MIVDSELRLERLDAAAVIGFIVEESQLYSAASMKVTTSSMRSLLRYLSVTEVLDRDLAGAVPSVTG